ncbi:iron ABC transporter permease [Paralcaligenes sp. KSB-10]|jgi:iron complex transport system permease protein|uniref:FecCD family ABC transporter permease n=1 Tax=Paralcaligenes sp. KSB-10 TaxID=2901142 RepID=UPI001E38B973|nr:iron ABC transporter permease [Paralcaligenes sp. KSB-10]UHL64322.1 iron ABC transporter permease [Paralcaligenes sp. KSB-10]
MPDDPGCANSRAYQSVWRRRKGFLVLLLGVMIGLLCIDVLVGPAGLSADVLGRVLLNPRGADPTMAIIVWQIRLPQALMAIVIGAALGLAGAEMQTVLNNPLASPFTLGISSAAALGASLALVFDFNLPFVPNQYVLAANAFVFALFCAYLLDLVARKARIGTAGIVLFGIALVFTFNALLSLVQFTASAAALQDLIFWMMGSLARTDWPRLGAMSLVLAIVFLYSLRQSWQLTALRFGDERATSFGVDTQKVRRAALIRISILAALAVALVGVIGFIGLIAPHIARRFWGEDHRWYLPASALTGSVILIAASIASKLLATDAVLPVGIVTTLVGIPFFLIAVLRRKVLQ